MQSHVKIQVASKSIWRLFTQKSTDLEEIKKHKYVLTPGRYVGIPDEEDDGVSFEEKMEKLTEELRGQMKEGRELDEEIKKNLETLGFKINMTYRLTTPKILAFSTRTEYYRNISYYTNPIRQYERKH